jgi:hypothetical protein
MNYQSRNSSHETEGMVASRISCLVWLTVLVLSIAVPRGSAQTLDSQVYYTRQPEIRVPFGRDTSNRLKQVQLYVSTDMGRDWRLVQTAPPDAGFFPPFTASTDGTYWFAVRSLDFQDRPNPATLGQLVPQLRIILDRRPPQIALRQISDTRQNIVTVEWSVQDENFDPQNFVVQYKVPGTDWQRQAEADGKQNGTQSWRLEPGLRMEVRVRAGDKAGNRAEMSIPVSYGQDGRAPDPPPSTSGDASAQRDSNPSSGNAGPGGVFYSKSTKISIGYRFDRRPISGIQVFDLWYTTDKGQHWTKAPQKGDGTSGAMPATPGGGGTESTVGKLIFEATAQGLYGFIPVARNGVGIGDPDPRAGDPPKYWVMVDTDAPKVALKVQPGQGYEVKNVRIEWSAEDANLTDRPVTLEYAEIRSDNATPADSDWKPIPQDNLTGRLDRSGVQVWSVGRSGPYKFFVRAKAEDKAGNVGIEQWREPIVVDLEHPSVNITGIEAAPPR